MKLFRKKESQALVPGAQAGGRFARIKHKKWIAFTAVALTAAIAAAVLIPKGKAAAASSSEDLSLARTVTLEKGSLDSTVSVSGVVRSGTVSTVTTTLTSKVVSVNVAVGDKVKKGDVIAMLDTSDLDKQIADKESQLRDANQQLTDEAARIQGQLDRAKTSRTQTQTAQDALVASATAARDNAKKALDPAKASFDAAKVQYDAMNASLANAQAALQNAQSARQTAYAAWQAAGGQTSVTATTPASTAADGSAIAASTVTTVPAEYTAYQTADAAVAAAQASLDTAKSVYSYDTVSAAYTAAQTQYSTAKDTLTQAQAALDSAVSARQSAMTESDNTIADLAAQLKAAADKAKKGTSDSDLEDLKKKKEGATLKAETDGEITEMNVTVGSVPKDSVAKVQSTTDLVLRVTIPEADINRVSVGLPVRITADSLTATVSGTLSRISPTADSSDSGASAAAAGYSADIAITDPAGLHIGSKAKGDIVLSTKSDVFTVPIDAVGTDASNQNYIRSMQADGTTVNVPVTTGDKNEYNIEISGDGLKAGMSVLADADWSALAKSSASNMNSEVVF